MCSQFGNKVSYRQYVDAFAHIDRPLVDPGPELAPNLDPRDLIRPTDQTRVIRPVAGGVSLSELRWGFKPARPKAGPVINFRSDGRAFGRGRCLIPASFFFEFTGAKSPKTKWRFTRTGEDWFCLAGLWRPGADGWPDSVTMLTAEPGPDVAPYHDRQVVTLNRSEWAGWLDPEADPAPFLRPKPAGFLHVEQASPTQELLI
jgi:putative SOS response-associated peptidase YedK